MLQFYLETLKANFCGGICTLDAGEIKFYTFYTKGKLELIKKSVHFSKRMVFEELMIPLSNCVLPLIVHRLNCSSHGAQKALAANYAITGVTIYALHTFARLLGFHKFPVEGSAFANKYNYL